eukprot:CAMPEP_0195053868 /NCGR_PEP_ID=MMETSP0448-20130528/2886_1 /TAXON_ID=66468 /ORGANISM="Heterocapsa triquestra, Strain CCMP 448" /LENGTH=48 /DNA_ID= /DNA_START= /DNA_END= /DNA_ORIENTATION=
MASLWQLGQRHVSGSALAAHARRERRFGMRQAGTAAAHDSISGQRGSL